MQRGAPARAFVEHRHRQAGGSGRGELVRRVTGVENQRQFDDGRVGAFDQKDFQPVVEPRPRERRKADLRELAGRRHAAPIGTVGVCGQLRIGMHFEYEGVSVQPLCGGASDVFRRRGVDDRQRLPVAIGRSAVDLVAGQHAGLAARPADALDAAQERSALPDFRALEFLAGRPVVGEAPQFFADYRLDARQLDARLGRRHQVGDPGQFQRQRRECDVGRGLIGIDEPLVEARILAGREDAGRECQVLRLRSAPARSGPGHVHPRLRHPVLYDLPTFRVMHRDPRPWLDQWWTGRDIAEVPADLGHDLVGVDIARDRNHGIVRSVVGLEPLAHILQRRGIQVFHRADHLP